MQIFSLNYSRNITAFNSRIKRDTEIVFMTDESVTCAVYVCFMDRLNHRAGV